jgi:hypothetical protein
MSVVKLQQNGNYKNHPSLSNLSLNWACSQKEKTYLVAAEPSHHVLNRGPMKDISMWYQLYL